MLKFNKWFEFIVIVLVIGFSFAACKKDSLDKTTWKANDDDQEYILKFNNPNFTITDEKGESIEGSYSISGSTVSIEGKEDFGGDKFNMTGTISGNVLTFTDRDETLIFKKQ